MDCHRNFVISIDNQTTFSGADVKTWTVGGQNFWAVRILGISTFEIQGFKNIDIYGVDIIGAVNTQIGAIIGGVNVEDWSFEILMPGQNPLASGLVLAAPNFWNIDITGVGRSYSLSKNTNSLTFSEPIKSVRNITFAVLYAQGTGAETLGSVSLDYDFNFVFHYKFEGE